MFITINCDSSLSLHLQSLKTKVIACFEFLYYGKMTFPYWMISWSNLKVFELNFCCTTIRWHFRTELKLLIKFKGNTYHSTVDSNVIIIAAFRNQSYQQQSLLITFKGTMKHLLSVSVILFCLHISFIPEVTGSQISRWKRQDEAPADFDCSLCGYCKWERIENIFL